MAAGLGQSAYRVHCRCTQPNHEVTRTDQRQSFLLLDGPVRNRSQDLRGKLGIPCSFSASTWSLLRSLCEMARSSRTLATMTSCPSS
jgi:hypothetical protein